MLSLALFSLLLGSVSAGLGINNPVQLWPCGFGGKNTETWTAPAVAPAVGPIALNGPLYLTINLDYAAHMGVLQVNSTLNGNLTTFSLDGEGRLTANASDKPACLAPEYDLLFPGNRRAPAFALRGLTRA